MRIRIALALLVLAGCASSDSPAEDEPTLGFERLVRLGSEQPPGDIPSRPTALARESTGSFVLFIGANTTDPLPMRFAEDGSFLGQVGRTGQGPGEFLYASIGTVTPGDSTLVFDRRASRYTVVGEGLPRTGRGTPFEVAGASIISWPDSILTTVWGGRGLSPYALISLRDDSLAILSELGAGPPLPYSGLRMALAASPSEGRIWVADSFDYSLYLLSFGGDTLRTLTPSSADFNTESMRLYPDSVPRSWLLAIEEIGDTLVTAFSVARDDWEEAWRGGDFTDPSLGSAHAKLPADYELSETMIEFRSSTTGELLGSQRLPGMVFDILPDGSIAQFVVEGPGFYFVDVWVR